MGQSSHDRNVAVEDAGALQQDPQESSAVTAAPSANEQDSRQMLDTVA